MIENFAPDVFKIFKNSYFPMSGFIGTKTLLVEVIPKIINLEVQNYQKQL